MSSNTLTTLLDFQTVDTFSGSYPDPEIGDNNTDLIYQQVKVYIEGVEVPFTSISISQAMGALPSCELEVPPQAGLMEITRYYQPKIHIFYTDNDRGGDRLLFWGNIASSAYTRSRAGSGYAAIHFRCNHRVKLAHDILLYFGNAMTNTANTETRTSNTPVGTNAMGDLNSASSITRALSGVTGIQSDAKDVIAPYNPSISDADVSKLSTDFSKFEQRLIGMPGVIVNLWNQLKKSACIAPTSNLNLLTMYIPLFEQGISYFKRLSGHYLLENQQQNSRVQYCPDGKSSTPLLVPPAYRTGSTDAVQARMALNASLAGVGFSGEMSSFLGLCESLYTSIEYEILTLASPAEVSLDPTTTTDANVDEFTAVETIVKPQIPFYYSPICNVIFPRMFESIDIQQDEEAVPSRIVAYHPALPQDTSGTTANYRAPNTIRESLSLAAMLSGVKSGDKVVGKYDFKSTTGNDFNIPGKYEQGRGIHPVKINLPYWLAILAKNQSESSASNKAENYPTTGSDEYRNLLLQTKAWEDRYGYSTVQQDGPEVPATRNTEKDSLNPFGLKTNINVHERILVAAADYEYTKAVARARSGTVSCVFNPYIVPGYPMDILDDSPNHPSFHGLCSSVTHTITSRSIATTVGIVAATTYAEMSNYYAPPLHPWLQTALGMLNENMDEDPTDGSDGPANYGDTKGLRPISSTLLQNPNAKLMADEFYQSVLGVGAADPTTMYDFGTGEAIPQYRSGAVLEAVSEWSDWKTTVGNLRLVSRNIESKDSIESKFYYTFIDLNEDNYGGSAIEYSSPILGSNRQLEPGASMFLDYLETEKFIDLAKAKLKSS